MFVQCRDVLSAVKNYQIIHDSTALDGTRLTFMRPLAEKKSTKAEGQQLVVRNLPFTRNVKEMKELLHSKFPDASEIWVQPVERGKERDREGADTHKGYATLYFLTREHKRAARDSFHGNSMFF